MHSFCSLNALHVHLTELWPTPFFKRLLHWKFTWYLWPIVSGALLSPKGPTHMAINYWHKDDVNCWLGILDISRSLLTLCVFLYCRITSVTIFATSILHYLLPVKANNAQNKRQPRLAKLTETWLVGHKDVSQRPKLSGTPLKWKLKAAWLFYNVRCWRHWTTSE